MTKIEQLKEILNDPQYKSIVVFSGAGLSTGSGIPDFRSANGIFYKKLGYKASPEELVSHTFFMNYPEEFYDFYFKYLVYPDAKPNIAHKYFASLEKNHKVTCVTQNIDNLHQDGGSTDVVELHGSVKRNYCMKCHKFYDIKDITHNGIPFCQECNAMIKPDVVLYEEGLNENTIQRAVKAISTCDIMIITGTSLVVYPAASFVRYFNGKKLILLNKTQTQYDSMADIAIYDDVCKVCEELMK